MTAPGDHLTLTDKNNIYDLCRCGGRTEIFMKMTPQELIAELKNGKKKEGHS